MRRCFSQSNGRGSDSGSGRVTEEGRGSEPRLGGRRVGSRWRVERGRGGRVQCLEREPGEVEFTVERAAALGLRVERGTERG
eukprot:1088056-Rhodomonas_salina.1